MENLGLTAIEENFISIFVPMTIKKRGGRGSLAIITLPQGKSPSLDDQPNYDYRLINAFTKARKLQQKIEKDPKLTISSLATKEGLTHGYLGRLLRLNLLAPEIVEAILYGKQPKNLRLIDFMRKEIPLLWDEQKEKFGFND